MGPGNLLHFTETFFLEGAIADRQDFVHNQNLRFQMRCDGKGEPHIHAAGVAFDRRIEEFFHFGECDNGVEFLFDFRACHSKDCAIEKNVFPPGQFLVKTGSHFKQAGDPAG